MAHHHHGNDRAGITLRWELSLKIKKMSTAISVKNLHRHFGPLKAVDGISFDVPHGSVCGFVGANGAGSTGKKYHKF